MQRTTTRLTIPLAYRPMARTIAAGVVVAIVVLAFILDALEKRQAATVEPVVTYIIITATPLPPVPTATLVPTLAPTEQPAPTPEPEVIYVLVEVPVYVPVPVAIPTAAPPTVVYGEVIGWDGATTQIAP